MEYILVYLVTNVEFEPNCQADRVRYRALVFQHDNRLILSDEGIIVDILSRWELDFER